MKSERTIRFIRAMKGQGLSEKGVEEILSVLDEREGELATKTDIVRLEEGQKRLADRIKWSQWSLGIVAAIVIGGFTLLGAFIIDTKADIREIRTLLLHLQNQRQTS